MKLKFHLLLIAVAIVQLTCSCSGYYAYVRANKASIHGGESWADPLGAQAGAGGSIVSISDNLGLGAEAGISMQGAKWEEMGYSGRLDLLYINVPVLLRYQSPKGFYGEAGVQPGFLISAKDKYDGGSFDYLEEMNKFDLSIPIGIGYEFGNKIGIGFRVVPGLSDITADEDEKDTNFVLSLGVSYKFGKRK